MDKRRNGNHQGFVDTSYHLLHNFTMPCVEVMFSCPSLGALHTTLMAHAGSLNSLIKPSWPDAEEVHEEMYALAGTLMAHEVDQK
jgi:hypothetical protein